jgi:hypothetical protein
VVWLNEIQFYLETPGSDVQERVAGALHSLLNEPARGPVLVLGTVWPEHWDTLTRSVAPGEADPHAQARAVLAGSDLRVADAFTGQALVDLGRAARDDVRLAMAMADAEDGQVIQYLAGVPELLGRYRNARPAARALIHAAMDARRLGHGPALPLGFLEAAAPGYLTSLERDTLAAGWLEEAIASTSQPAKGVRGPLTRFNTRSSSYRLADYLEQIGRRDRAGQLPPAVFWEAAAAHADPGALGALAARAEDRGLYRHAAMLHKRAIDIGHPGSPARLVSMLRTHTQAGGTPPFPPVDHGRTAPADHWVAAHASLTDPAGVAALLDQLRWDRAEEAVTELLARDPARHADLGDPGGVADLLSALQMRGAEQAVATLVARDPARHADLTDPEDIARLVRALGAAGASQALTALADRAAAQTSLTNVYGVAYLVHALAEARADRALSVLAERAATHTSLTNLYAVSFLADNLRRARADHAHTILVERAVAGTDVTNRFAALDLAHMLREAGAGQLLTAESERIVAHADPRDGYNVGRLIEELHAGGAHDAVTALLALDPARHADLTDPRSVAVLLKSLRAAGAHDAVTALLARDPAVHAELSETAGVASLLAELRAAQAHDAVTALLARDPAVHAKASDTPAVSFLLAELRAAGAHDAVTVLARRAAEHSDLSHETSVAGLLETLRDAGTSEAAATLAARAANAGMYERVVRAFPDKEDQFKFGREPDNRPSPRWDWADIGYQGMTP